MTAAGVTVTDAMVEAYDEARSAARRRGGEDETRAGLTAVAPLIAAQALRDIAADVRCGEDEQTQLYIDRAGLGDCGLNRETALRARIYQDVRRMVEERADELERGTDQ